MPSNGVEKTTELFEAGVSDDGVFGRGFDVAVGLVMSVVGNDPANADFRISTAMSRLRSSMSGRVPIRPYAPATWPAPGSDPARLSNPDGLKPANGPDWAWLAVIDNMSTAPTPAALIACPNNLESDGFILSFPIQIDDLAKIVAPHRKFSVAAMC